MSNPFSYKKPAKIKPKHDLGTMKVLLEVVRMLNGVFTVNNYNPFKKIKPFYLVWTYKSEWHIVCDNHWVWNDSEEFRKLRKEIDEALSSEVEYKWSFYIEAEVWNPLENVVFKVF